MKVCDWAAMVIAVGRQPFIYRVRATPYPSSTTLSADNGILNQAFQTLTPIQPLHERVRCGEN